MDRKDGDDFQTNLIWSLCPLRGIVIGNENSSESRHRTTHPNDAMLPYIIPSSTCYGTQFVKHSRYPCLHVPLPQTIVTISNTVNTVQGPSYAFRSRPMYQAQACDLWDFRKYRFAWTVTLSVWNPRTNKQTNIRRTNNIKLCPKLFISSRNVFLKYNEMNKQDNTQCVPWSKAKSCTWCIFFIRTSQASFFSLSI